MCICSYLWYLYLHIDWIRRMLLFEMKSFVAVHVVVRMSLSFFQFVMFVLEFGLIFPAPEMATETVTSNNR